jgi:hypothetical protein
MNWPGIILLYGHGDGWRAYGTPAKNLAAHFGLKTETELFDEGWYTTCDLTLSHLVRMEQEGIPFEVKGMWE